jgi:hypothetical protein
VVDAASMILDDLALRFLAGKVDEVRVVKQVEHLVIETSDHGIIELPLGALYALDDEWAPGRWGHPTAELKRIVHSACIEQIRVAGKTR